MVALYFTQLEAPQHVSSTCHRNDMCALLVAQCMSGEVVLVLIFTLVFVVLILAVVVVAVVVSRGSRRRRGEEDMVSKYGRWGHITPPSCIDGWNRARGGIQWGVSNVPDAGSSPKTWLQVRNTHFLKASHVASEGMLTHKIIKWTMNVTKSHEGPQSLCLSNPCVIAGWPSSQRGVLP